MPHPAAAIARHTKRPPRLRRLSSQLVEWSVLSIFANINVYMENAPSATAEIYFTFYQFLARKTVEDVGLATGEESRVHITATSFQSAT